MTAWINRRSWVWTGVVAEQCASAWPPAFGIGEQGEERVVARLVDMAALAHGRHEPLELGVGQVPLSGHAPEH
jgi:hypothetical protein